MLIDCDTCTARPSACSDCVVSVLLGPPGEIADDHREAVAALADSGLVPPLRLIHGGGDASPLKRGRRGGSRARGA